MCNAPRCVVKVKASYSFSFVLPFLPHPLAVDQARRDLMRCVQQSFPRCWTNSAQMCCQPTKRLQSPVSRLKRFYGHPRLSPFKKLSQDSSLRAALWRWASEFHAEQDWFLDEMLHTLRGWHVSPGWLRTEVQSHRQSDSVLAMGEPFKSLARAGRCNRSPGWTTANECENDLSRSLRNTKQRAENSRSLAG
jgi:hypothetical protein